MHGHTSSPLLPSQVNLHREFIFRNSKQDYNGVPIIASNMDTVGTFEMAKTLAEVPYLYSCTLSSLCVYGLVLAGLG